jgi:hypothetical protein
MRSLSITVGASTWHMSMGPWVVVVWACQRSPYSTPCSDSQIYLEHLPSFLLCRPVTGRLVPIPQSEIRAGNDFAMLGHFHMLLSDSYKNHYHYAAARWDYIEHYTLKGGVIKSIFVRRITPFKLHIEVL